MSSPASTPALAAVQADDALLDLLGRGGCPPGDAGCPLVACLAALRRDLHADSSRLLMTTDRAVAVMNAAARRPSAMTAGTVLVIVFAVAVIVFAVLVLVSLNASPDDPLSLLHQLLYQGASR